MKVLLMLLVVSIHQTSAVIYRLNEREYGLMPPLFHLDAYEACLALPDALYCSVGFELVSDSHSDLLAMIREYSEHRSTHYNHSRLHYGICMTQNCKRYQQDKTEVPEVALEECLNENLWRDYNLKAKLTERVWCNNSSENMRIDAVDITVAVVCILLLVSNIVGSLCTVFCKNKGEGFIKYALCFSLQRNWQKMSSPSGSGPEPRLTRLKGFYALRTITMAMVIACHSLLPFMISSENTQYVEESYHDEVYKLIVSGTPVVQTFFLMSGVLLAFSLELQFGEKRAGAALLPQGLLKRWLRLTPSYALVLALTSTWLRFLGSGPLWQNLVMEEVADCRRYWWTNLLYINNYFDSFQCIGPSWYLAADVQLHFVGLCVFAMARGAARKVVLGVLFLAGLIMPAVHTYVQDLDGAVLLSPETSRKFFITDPTFNQVYKRGHTNLASFVIGLCLGFQTLRWMNAGFTLNKYTKYRIVYWLLFPAMLCLVYAGSVFYADGARAPLATRVACAALVKPAFAMLVAAVVIGMVFEFETPYRRVLEWRGWAAPSRTSYCAYILHMLLIKSFNGSRTSLVHVTFFNCAVVAITTVAVSFLLAIPFSLMVESPIERVLRIVASGPKKIVDAKD